MGALIDCVLPLCYSEFDTDDEYDEFILSSNGVLDIPDGEYTYDQDDDCLHNYIEMIPRHMYTRAFVPI